MATATLAHPSKPCKAFYAHLYDEEGVLTKVNGAFYFIATETGTITEIEIDHLNFLSTRGEFMYHGEVGLTDTQRLMDQLHGGLAYIATHRNN